MNQQELLHIMDKHIIDNQNNFPKMKLSIDNWRTNIPSDPGWYFIETNTPKAVFQKVGQPKQGTHHYNIPERLKYSSQLENSGLTIEQKSEGIYVVYNGEAKDLKARAREHVFGADKTYCLGLKNYSDLHKYKWHFWYVTCDELALTDDKGIRIFGEQIWRATHGWPILCKR